MQRSLLPQALRWAAVLPGSLLAAIATRILNYSSAAYMGVDPRDGGFFAALFGDLSTVLEAAVIVVAASLIAPTGRIIVATLIGTFQAFFWGVLPIVEISMNRVLIGTDSRPGALWVLMGSVIGVTYIHNQEKKRKSEEMRLTKTHAS